MFRQTCDKLHLDRDYEEDRYYFNAKDGSLHIGTSSEFYEMHHNDDYCVDFVRINGTISQETFVCFSILFPVVYLYTFSLVISSVFLIVTIFVYTCSPKVSVIIPFLILD